MEFSGLSYVLMDIEGTTSDINFVKKVMFPYSVQMLPSFVQINKETPIVKEIMEKVDVETLLLWIANDEKRPELKTLQGLIWKEAFEDGAFLAPLYDDVLPAWRLWLEKGLNLGIYSSGSVTAQKMFFGHSTEGDLLHLLSHHFDLDIGGKKEVKSYQLIAKELAIAPNEILFLSDVPEELVAAKEAGFKIAHVVREGTEESSLPTIHSFSELQLSC